MTDICLMRYACSVCNKVFWGYAKCSFKTIYEDNISFIEVYTQQGKFTQQDIVRFTEDGIPMIETTIIRSNHKCKIHTQHEVLSSYG